MSLTGDRKERAKAVVRSFYAGAACGEITSFALTAWMRRSNSSFPIICHGVEHFHDRGICPAADEDRALNLHDAPCLKS